MSKPSPRLILDKCMFESLIDGLMTESQRYRENSCTDIEYTALHAKVELISQVVDCVIKDYSEEDDSNGS